MNTGKSIKKPIKQYIIISSLKKYVNIFYLFNYKKYDLYI